MARVRLKQLAPSGATNGQVIAWVAAANQWVPATMGGGGGGGYATGVRQIVSNFSGTVGSTSTILPADGTIPQSNEGAQFLAATITPQSATSTILAIASIAQTAAYSTGATVCAALFRDSDSNAFAATAHGSAATASATPLIVVASIPSTSVAPTTIKVRVGMSVSGTLYWNGFTGPTTYFGGVAASGITLIEYGV